MRAVTAVGTDEQDPLSCLRVDDEYGEPSPPENWQVVEVAAASLNHHDLFNLRGMSGIGARFPTVLGSDGAGVDAAGRRVLIHAVIADPMHGVDETLARGSSLLSDKYDGTMAERVAVPAANLVPLPDEISFEEAACLPTAFLTAFRMLFTKARVMPGQRVLIQGAGPLQLPDAIWQSPPPSPAAPEEGAMVRIQARTFLVQDLDAVLRALSVNLDWEPVGPTETFATEGFRRARLGFRVEHSATIDLIQPLRWNCPAGRYLHTWGPGPYATRILVNGLDAASANLSDRGTRHQVTVDESAPGGRKIIVDPAELVGTLIEFVDWKP